MEGIYPMFTKLRDAAKNSFTGPALAIGLGVTTALSSLPANQAFAGEEPTANEYIRKGITDSAQPAERPTKERPYHYMRMDEEAQQKYPYSSIANLEILHGDKLVVLNFIDERSRFSAMQTQVLTQTMTALADTSAAKELMLIDVVVMDKNGKGINLETYELYARDNKLGPNGASIETGFLPYGVAIGDTLTPDGKQGSLFDFALMNGVKTDADLNENAKSIYGMLRVTVKAYNQRHVATLASQPPVFAAANLD